MALKARQAKSGERDYPVAAPHLARVVGITDLGHQPGYEYRGNKIESSWKIEITYELVNSLMKDGRPHWVSEDIKSNNYEKNGKMSNLMARIRAIDPNNDSRDGDDLLQLLGKPCMVTVTHNEEGFPKIKGQGAVSGVPLGMDIKELYNEPFAFDMDNPDMHLWDSFPEFKKEKIKSALNFTDTELLKVLAKEDEL